MNLSRRNLTETKLEILILEYLNPKPYLEELIKDTEDLGLIYIGYVIIGPNTNISYHTSSKRKYKWQYCKPFYIYKNEITRDLMDKFNPNLRNRYESSKSYIWY